MKLPYKGFKKAIHSFFYNGEGVQDQNPTTPGSTVLHTLFVFCVGGCVGGRGMNQHAAGRTLLFRKRPADFPRQW